ncbi:hypothetical protein RB195_008269 [Necator americanus]|uniref:Small RNA 2'-O-methyltransferase n=2 Tax=Necator americanus TaxID=51031 RepID=A0ABR1CMS3_NECAM
MSYVDSHFSDDGWPLPYDFDRILHSYEEIYEEVAARPIEDEIGEAPVHFFDYDELTSKPRFFTPPLQYQRNSFVRDVLSNYTERTKKKIKKLAVLGCGALSLERFLMLDFGSMGVERVVSVDISAQELAKGLKFLNIVENQNENIICNTNALPVLFEVYRGDILEYDERLAGTSCVCSTEVIEHISQEDATRYVRSVLLTIQPQLFILSTPNHDYNEAFGMPSTQFRHSDHKFEFTRQQFKYWLHTILADFGADYDYSVEYVGNVPRFTHLGGATQFAVIRRKHSELSVVLPCIPSSPYKKVGEAIAKNSLFSLEREKLKQAFILWLQRNPLREENLLKTYIGSYWRIRISSIVDLIELPHPLKKKMNRKVIADILRFLCNGRVIYETHNDEACLDIPFNVTKDELIGIMISRSS